MHYHALTIQSQALQATIVGAQNLEPFHHRLYDRCCSIKIRFQFYFMSLIRTMQPRRDAINCVFALASSSTCEQVKPSNKLYLSEFSLYSIGVITSRLNKSSLFDTFVNDVLVTSPVNRVKHGASELMQIGNLKIKYKLDFDDAYQYLIAMKYNLTIVSFDTDFDQTPLGRTMPSKLTE